MRHARCITFSFAWDAFLTDGAFESVVLRDLSWSRLARLLEKWWEIFVREIVTGDSYVGKRNAEFDGRSSFIDNPLSLQLLIAHLVWTGVENIHRLECPMWAGQNNVSNMKTEHGKKKLLILTKACFFLRDYCFVSCMVRRKSLRQSNTDFSCPEHARRKLAFLCSKSCSQGLFGNRNTDVSKLI